MATAKTRRSARLRAVDTTAGAAERGAGAPSLDGMLDRLAALRGGLSPTARHIAEFILANAAEVVHMSVTEVAERTQASEGSVVGLCQQLGARGFQQLKITLARDLVQPVHFIHEDLSRGDSTATILQKIFASNTQALQDTLKVLDAAQVARAVAAIRKAQRVEVYGIGSAAPIAEDANYRLVRIGIESKVVVDSHVQAISASLTGSRVATITISHSGSTIETVTATRLAREAGATTICITNYGRSPLRKHADIVLHTMAKETRFRTEAMTSRIAQLAIVDVLIAALALATYDKSVATIARTFDVLSAKRY